MYSFPDEMTGRGKLHFQKCLWILIFSFYIENIFGGALGVFPDLSGRYLLFISASLSSLILAFKKGGRVPKYTCFPLFAVALFLSWNFVWATLVPALSSTPLHFAWLEAKPLAALMTVFLFVAAARGDISPLTQLIRCIVISVIILSGLQFAIWIYGTLIPEHQIFLRTFIKQIYSGNSIYVGTMPDGFFRVFWISSMWLIPALFYLPIVVKSYFLRGISLITLTGALFATYSRGIWVGIAIGALFWLVPRVARYPCSRFKVIHIVIGIPVLFSISIILISYLAPAIIERTSSLVSLVDGSPDVRALQTQSLLSAWAERPLLGAGYGSHASYVRSLSAPYTYEMVPFALLMKLGAIGFIGFLSFFIVVIVSTIFGSRTHFTEAFAFLASFIAFLFAAMTNPLLYNFVGGSILSMLLIHWVFLFRYDASEFKYVRNIRNSE